MSKHRAAVRLFTALAVVLAVSLQAGYADTIFESYEDGFGPWRAEGDSPMEWRVTRSQTIAHDGTWSLDFTADGRADDGTVWVVREIQLPAGNWDVNLDFYIYAVGGPIGAWTAIGFIGLFEPTIEEDFTQNPAGENLGAIAGDGWTKFGMQRTLSVGQPSTAWVAFGYNIVFEVNKTHYFDSATITGVPIQCGNGTCFGGENPCNCPADCGAPPASESVCDDGLDDDCDGLFDCIDSDCKPNPMCEGVKCDGDLVCEEGETVCDCAIDCGTPPLFETSCTNEFDDNCNGFVDCDDFDCMGAPECWEPPPCDYDGTCETGEDCNNCPNDCISGSGGAVCGNGLCEAGDGEDCETCAADCNGYLVGGPSGRFCCGDGTAKYGITCADPRCTESGWDCTTEPQGASYCCGDGTCEGAEDISNCAIDCGCSSPAECDDSNECTVDDCVGGVCENTPVADGTPCSGGICCGGTCAAVVCSISGDCADSEACTTDTCHNGGTCSAYCENVWPACGLADGCCGPSCDSGNDPDCETCLARGEACILNSECCSNSCHKGACK